MSNERKKIEDDIEQLEQLKTAGAMPAALAERLIEELRQKQAAAYTATQTGDGATAQGQDAFAVGANGLGIKGNVNGDVVASGGTLEKHYHLPADASPEELRAAYLNHLLEAASQLQLSGIDPKTASDAEARLELGAVYTALLTLSTEDDDAAAKDKRADVERLMERGETRRASALMQLNRHNRLVLLGDPGSGKSTFVNFVAMCLVGERLGNKTANLSALTMPLPVDEDAARAGRNKDEKPQPQPWQHGALLPVRVILRDFAARGLPPVGEPASAKTLWDFIVSELDAWALREFEKPLMQELREKGGLLLLDGLDEVPEADARRGQIKQALEGFAASFPKCRILVTSRTYAYQKQDWRLNGFAESVLAPFSRGQIRSFVERWYAHIASLRRLAADDAQGRAEMLKRAIFTSERLMGLAERPLLLTLMASLHAWRGGTLPEKREELYADAVELLLDWWESPKSIRNARGELLMRQPSLVEWLKVDRDKVRKLLEALAYQAHAAQAELTGTADIAESDLVSGLMCLSQNPDINPRQLVEYLSVRAGLLIPRGVGVYTFPHRTFQEYLAACYLTDHDYPEKVAELACDDINRWREVALLAGAKAGRGTASAIWSLVDALCFTDPAPDAPERHQWGAHLAGRALVESGSLNNVSERNLPKRERVQKWLVHILESGRLPALERARAGDSLATLGDPRFDPEHWFLPADENLGFIRIPAGRFIMGSNDAYESEKPQHELDMPYDYWLAKYPVTVAQYRFFVEQSSYQTSDTDSLRGVFNHPVTWVSWHDALAYCDWLNAQLQSWAKTVNDRPLTEKNGLPSTVHHLHSAFVDGRLCVSLPSEAEWEKAARGVDGRTYPWGPNADPNRRANYDATGISGTSPVGAFPDGVSPYGLLDMSGNTWEWTRSEGGKTYPYDKDDGREDIRQKETIRAARGGSFIFDVDLVRCASRSRFFPDNKLNYFGFRIVVVSPFFSQQR